MKSMFDAKIHLKTVNQYEDVLTTCEITYPRCIHSEFMTHRAFSRNAASSRAIPIEKMIERVEDDPFIPLHWGRNQKGMQAETELSESEIKECEYLWLEARDEALDIVRELLDIGLHKQIANRLLEPWMWITVIVTGSSSAYENFFKLRCHKDAEPHIQKIAYLLREAYDCTEPTASNNHIPLTGFPGDETLNIEQLKKVSVARCARVSYLTHDGLRDVDADLALFNRLEKSGHWSPFEHVAWCPPDQVKSQLCGNLNGHWVQYRKTFVNEYCRKAPR